MNKSIKNIATIAFMALLTFSFTAIKKERKEINVTKSNVIWKGYKVTGSHQGTIAIKSGHLNFTDSKLTGGAFVINMLSINNTDLDGEYKGKLEGHLKSDDFFGVKKFPTATLKFKKVKSIEKNAYKVTGDLTIKGKTNSVKFTLSVYGNKASVSLKIDRSKFNVKYGSGSFFDNLGDKTIYDEFDLGLKLVGTK